MTTLSTYRLELQTLSSDRAEFFYRDPINLPKTQPEWILHGQAVLNHNGEPPAGGRTHAWVINRKEWEEWGRPVEIDLDIRTRRRVV